MKNKIKRIGIGLGVGIMVLGTTVSFSEPGSDKDPLVTVSYVNKKIEEIKHYIDEKVSDNKGNESPNEFIVVEVLKDQSIILGGGSEAILRSGEATAISRIENGIDNGIADLTLGVDVKMGETIERDHLLLTPRNDGRGARVIRDAMFLVRGAYTIR